MTPDDVTQPYQQPSMPPNPPAWSPQPAPRPVTPYSPSQPRARMGILWAVLAFIAGCILTAIVAMVALAPAPAPVSSAQTSSSAMNVTITDSLLTTAMASNQGGSGVTLAQPRAHIQANGEITISGVLQGTPAGAGTVVTVVVQPYVSQNTLAVRILRTSVAGFALPPAALTALSSQINLQLAQSSHIPLGSGQGLLVSGVSFSDGAMTLSYAPAAG